MKERLEYLMLTCLTPVHIGSGAEYVNGVDFIGSAGRTYLLESERVLERLLALGELPRDVSDLKSRIARLFERQSPEPYATGCFDGAFPGGFSVRAAIRAGNGCPMIPGSSLKGALRTMLFAGRIGVDGPDTEPKSDLASKLAAFAPKAVPGAKRVAEPVEEMVFRSSVRDEFANIRRGDAKRDLLRMLSLSDAVFPPDSTQLLITAAVGTTRPTTLGVEALKPESKSVLRACFDFPRSDSFFTESLPAWEQLVQWSHRHALHLLTTDHAYFSPGNAPSRDCSRALERLEKLEALIKKSPADTLFLRLGWGTGWRTMTGDILNADQRKGPLPKGGEFGPKTRKVIVKDGSDNAAAVDVLGWISLTPVSETKALQTGIQPPLRPAPVSAPDTPVPENPPLQIDEFSLAVEKLQVKDWGQLGNFHQRALADPGRKDTRLAALGSKIAQVWKGDRRRLREAAEKFPELGPYIRTRS